uniref:Uncharacterized protein n=1 Tax=Glossina brevipalpis TaxID=37001 RepID=A0A1A9X537_9MUSC
MHKQLLHEAGLYEHSPEIKNNNNNNSNNRSGSLGLMVTIMAVVRLVFLRSNLSIMRSGMTVDLTRFAYGCCSSSSSLTGNNKSKKSVCNSYSYIDVIDQYLYQV